MEKTIDLETIAMKKEIMEIYDKLDEEKRRLFLDYLREAVCEVGKKKV